MAERNFVYLGMTMVMASQFVFPVLQLIMDSGG